ncbi:MAG TPA: hypothetical protein VK736_02190 [Candidatus Binatia bacterium]|nr:hypothetical protein [Candidatus Binatia bacterium]
MTRHRMTRFAPLLLGAVFGLALWAPIPAWPNTARADVMAQVEQRFPGWRIARASSSWEGAWSVVVSCRDRQVGFQLVPGHGLPAGDAWLHPEDRYSHARLAATSDDRTYLVWYRDAKHARSASCRTQVARPQPELRELVD